MIDRLKPKSEFSRNVLTLMTGVTIAQAIPIAATPILTRIYTPNDFGVFALFVSIVTILGSIANGRYELAIMLPEKDDDAINLAALGLLIAGCLSFCLLIIVLFFNTQIAQALDSPEVGAWLYFVPFVVLMTGLFNVLNYLNTREKLFKDIAKANIYKTTVMTSLQLGVGYIKAGASGLIIGQVLSQVVANYRLTKNVIERFDLTIVSKEKMSALSIKYADFPRFSMAAALVSSSASNVVNLFIPIVYDLSVLGHYSIVKRLLGAPSTLIGNAISQVLYQDIAKKLDDNVLFKARFYQILYRLIIMSMVVFIPAYYIVEDLFEIVLGKEWRIAGEYSKIMILMFAIQFIVSPLTRVNQVLLKNKAILVWQIFLFLTYLSVLGSVYLFHGDFLLLLHLLTSLVSICYLVYLLLIISYVNNATK